MGKWSASATRALREGARAAQRQHAHLGTQLDRRVDIFDIVEKSSIWLMFQPMQHLFGAYQRRGEAAGIVLNSDHPESLQRYTAAHEYGHHVLGHTGSLDDDRNIEAPATSLRPEEIAAQAFAADFLMPLQLVNHTLRRMKLGLKPQRLSPSDVYKLSLEFGASYAATVTQLLALRKITPAAARSLRETRPLAVKEALAGARPYQGRADVWVLEAEESGRSVTARVDDEVHVYLSEMPSTGYVWEIAEQIPGGTEAQRNDVALELVNESFDDPNPDAYGVTGRRHFQFRVVRPGCQDLCLVKRRAWEHTIAPASIFVAHLTASQRRTGDFDRGLSEQQKSLLMAG